MDSDNKEEKMEIVVKEAEIAPVEVKEETKIVTAETVIPKEDTKTKIKRNKIPIIILCVIFIYIPIMMFLINPLLVGVLAFASLTAFAFIYAYMYEKELVRTFPNLSSIMIKRIGYFLAFIAILLLFIYGLTINFFITLSFTFIMASIMTVICIKAFAKKVESMKVLLYVLLAFFITLGIAFLILNFTLTDNIVDNIVSEITGK